MKKIAWIGTGVMGVSMAGHLLKDGAALSVYNRSPEKTRTLAEAGARVCDTVADAVRDADVVFTMVGYPSDVEQVYVGPDGILENAKKGAIAVDMTTSSPALAQKLYAEGKARGIGCLDAPVSGGDVGARAATLSIMVGGDAGDFEKVRPLLERMGKNIVLTGGAGFGQHTKAANQIAVAGATTAMTEAIVYAKSVGLDPLVMLSAITAGAAGSWQLSNMAPRVLKEDFAPGFYIKHFVKDLRIARDAARDKGVQLDMLEAALALYENMVECGFENDGTQALIKRYS